MKHTTDSLMVASRLVAELGDGAARHAKCRLVELTAAANPRAASFWREVMRICEDILERDSALAPRSGRLVPSPPGALAREGGVPMTGLVYSDEKRPG